MFISTVRGVVVLSVTSAAMLAAFSLPLFGTADGISIALLLAFVCACGYYGFLWSHISDSVEKRKLSARRAFGFSLLLLIPATPGLVIWLQACRNGSLLSASACNTTPMFQPWAFALQQLVYAGLVILTFRRLKGANS
jgi:hypothetical protein